MGGQCKETSRKIDDVCDGMHLYMNDILQMFSLKIHFYMKGSMFLLFILSVCLRWKIIWI